MNHSERSRESLAVSLDAGCRNAKTISSTATRQAHPSRGVSHTEMHVVFFASFLVSKKKKKTAPKDVGRLRSSVPKNVPDNTDPKPPPGLTARVLSVGGAVSWRPSLSTSPYRTARKKARAQGGDSLLGPYLSSRLLSSTPPRKTPTSIYLSWKRKLT